MRTLPRVLVFIASTMLASAVDMETVYKWKYVDYDWDSEAQRLQAIDSGEYNYTLVIPTDVDKAKDGRVFVSFVGIIGVPATLGTITNKMGPSGPLVRPYPDWSHFKRGDCDSIQNVYRIAIDECQRLWVIDTGYLDGEPRTCDPQLVVFDLKTDKLVQRIKFPEHIAKGSNGRSLMATPIVETYGQQCEDTTVYVADTHGLGIVVWNNGRLSRLENPVFKSSEDASHIVSGNFSADWNMGILTMALSPKTYPGEERLLYFRALNSFDVYAASTELLKRSTDGSDLQFFEAKNLLDYQAVGIAFSDAGVLFMGQLKKDSAIVCWNRYTEPTSDNVEIVAQDSDRLQYANGMKVIKDRYSGVEELWALTDRLVTVNYEELDFNDYNYYILKSPVNKLIAGTVCERPSEPCEDV